jgi:uncharacterized protein
VERKGWGNVLSRIKEEKIFIIFASLIACSILYIVEQGIGVNYTVKTAVKVLMFIGIPLINIKLIKKQRFIDALNLNSIRIRQFKTGIGAGVLFFFIVLIAYLITGSFIDLDNIALELQEKLKVTPMNFLFIGVYITIGNSFLEEFFFRGYIFLNLYNNGARKLAHFYSSLLFGVYHIAIFKTWFTLPITLLALLGLVIVSFLFNWMNTKSQNFINSWIAHALADAAIILIGLRMFAII